MCARVRACVCVLLYKLGVRVWPCMFCLLPGIVPNFCHLASFSFFVSQSSSNILKRPVLGIVIQTFIFFI